jgi:hypothetical protein
MEIGSFLEGHKTMAITQTNERTWKTPPENQREIPSPEPKREREEERSARYVTTGFSLEVLGGAGAVVLAILGLANIFPMYMLGISILLIGGTLLLQGGTVAARLNKLLHEISGGRTESVEVGGGLSAELVGGAAGIAIGILALVDVVPVILVSVAAVVFGATLLMSSGTVSRLAQLRLAGHVEHRTAEATREAAMSAAAAQALVGIARAALGIIALVGTLPITLSLIAMLSVGGSILLSGAAVSGRMLALIFG